MLTVLTVLSATAAALTGTPGESPDQPGPTITLDGSTFGVGVNPNTNRIYVAVSRAAGGIGHVPVIDQGGRGLRSRIWVTVGNGLEVGVVRRFMTTNSERSPTEWVRDQTEQILRTGTTDGVTVLDRPVVLFTVTGARSGKQRLVPLMRVEHEGRYAMIASKGGAPEHPAWYANVRANPEVTAQDGTAVARYLAREVHGVEREQWWARAVEAYPPYADYQENTDRLIPVLVLDPLT